MVLTFEYEPDGILEMKMFFLAAVMCGLCGSVQAQQPVTMPTPTLTARTNAVSKRIARSNTGTTKTAQESRAISVTVNVGFFSKPPQPYDVECFFIAKNEATLALSIFDASAETSQDKNSNFQFDSQPITGGAKRWSSVPFSGSFSGSNSDGGAVNGTFGGRLNSSSQTSGSKIEGWIVRVVAQGKVLRMESNQPKLLEMASKLPKVLDAAATKIEKLPN